MSFIAARRSGETRRAPTLSAAPDSRGRWKTWVEGADRWKEPGNSLKGNQMESMFVLGEGGRTKGEPKETREKSQMKAIWFCLFLAGSRFWLVGWFRLSPTHSLSTSK